MKSRSDMGLYGSSIDVSPAWCFLSILGPLLLLLIALPLSLPIFIVFRIYRAFLAARIRQEKGKHVALVAGNDALFLQDTPENRSIINSLLIMKGRPDVKRWREIMMTRVVEAMHPEKADTKLFPKMSKYSSKIHDTYVWTDDPKFDIENHVFVHPESVPHTQAELERIFGKICSTSLPSYRSRWQLILVIPTEDHVDFGRQYYVLLRTHHSLADGLSLIRMLTQKIVDEPPKSMQSQNKRTSGPGGALTFIKKVITEVPGLLFYRILYPKDRNILHGPLLSGVKIVSWSEPVDLRLIKRIKNVTGTSVNDVIVTCVATALREYFKIHASNVPRDILTYIPVNTRTASSNLTLENRFAFVFLTLPLDEDDQLKTLQKVKERMDKIKKSPEPVMNEFITNDTINNFPDVLSKSFFDFMSGKVTFTLTNVPGPQEKVTIDDQELDTLLFWGPQRNNISLGVSAISYNNTVRFGIYVDKSTMTNPKLLVSGFVDNVHKLANITLDNNGSL